MANSSTSTPTSVASEPRSGASGASAPAGVEVRSIDHIPESERHGKPRDLGTLFFMANAQLGTLVVGVASVTAGGNLLWSFVSIVAGTLFGTIFVALHAAQGPKLGLPQMIQSRPQFGYLGALLVWLFAYLNYFGFNVFNVILASDSLGTASGAPGDLWLLVPSGLALLIALVGYDLIHRVERWLVYVFLVVFGVLTVGAAITLRFPAGAFAAGGFHVVPFLLQFGITAGFQLGWAIYVSDYSRYLPSTVGVRRTSGWVYWGSGLGGIWLMCLGAMLAAAAGTSFETIGSLHAAGNGIFAGFGDIVLIFAALGLIGTASLNIYGGSLTLISAVDSFKRVRPTLTARTIATLVTAGISLVLAFVLSSNFLSNFQSFLLLLLYLFIPWTAINLVDFYVVRHGRYVISEIFNPHGMYGRWAWRGIVAYLIALGAEVPFFSTPLFSGPVADALSGADLSLFVGLPIAGGLYFLFSRSLDLQQEQRLVADQPPEMMATVKQGRGGRREG